LKQLARTLLIFLFCCGCHHTTNASILDSLKTELVTAGQDTQRVKLLVNLATRYMRKDLDSAKYYSKDGITLSEKLNYNKGIARTNHRYGLATKKQGNYEESIPYYKKALKYYKIINDEKNIVSLYNNIGNSYKGLGEYSPAAEHYIEALKLSEEYEDLDGMAKAYNNLGNLSKRQNKLETALGYLQKSLDIRKQQNDSSGMASTLHNLGNLYKSLDRFDDAIEAYTQSLSLRGEESAYERSKTYGAIGNYYMQKKAYDQAIEYQQKSVDMNRKIGNKSALANALNNLGESYLQVKDYANCVKNYEEGKTLGEEINAMYIMEHAYKGLANVNAKLSNYKLAYEYRTKYAQAKDSLLSEASLKQVGELEAQYQNEKKQKEIEHLNDQQILKDEKHDAEKARQDEQIQKQRLLIFGGIVLGLSLLILAFVLYRGKLQQTKANVLLEEQKQEITFKNASLEKANDAITSQKEMIEEKNHDIMDSIKYAKRIQEAILPPEQVIKESLNNSFILYKPKDIVSGDFYWMKQVDNKILFSVVDCTGHGVPGAFVSIIGHSGLNRSINEFGLKQPARVLDKLNEIVHEAFSQQTEIKEGQVRDGMDVALCSLNPDTMELEYAGANNPLWVVRSDGENGSSFTTDDNTEVPPSSSLSPFSLYEVKATKQPIGAYENTESFTNHRIQLQKGDTIYIFSDGYADQFGGKRGKKFKNKQFKELLLSIQNKPMDEQRMAINQTFENWKGELEQLDDICMIGVRI
jgi:serine phosphatase RsbU (regulator of sigma subunit)/uncharacterized protein HemY